MEHDFLDGGPSDDILYGDGSDALPAENDVLTGGGTDSCSGEVRKHCETG